MCERWVETGTDCYIDPTSSLDHSSTSSASWLELLKGGGRWGPQASVCKLALTLAFLSPTNSTATGTCLYSFIMPTCFCFCLFIQVHLWLMAWSRVNIQSSILSIYDQFFSLESLSLSFNGTSPALDFSFSIRLNSDKGSCPVSQPFESCGREFFASPTWEKLSVWFVMQCIAPSWISLSESVSRGSTTHIGLLKVLSGFLTLEDFHSSILANLKSLACAHFVHPMK